MDCVGQDWNCSLTTYFLGVDKSSHPWLNARQNTGRWMMRTGCGCHRASAGESMAGEPMAGIRYVLEKESFRPIEMDADIHMASQRTITEMARQLRNVGPALAARLVAAGIDSPKKLRELGAKRAFEKMYATGDAYGDFNAAYLYALEGAIRDCDWLAIPDDLKRVYKAFAQDLQAKKRAREH